jgi:hypothetical protein
VHGRTKKPDSLEKKLSDPAQNSGFVGWAGNISKHPDMWDLAGVRIGLFFPDDIPDVTKVIEAHFEKVYNHGTVGGCWAYVCTQSGDCRLNISVYTYRVFPTYLLESINSSSSFKRGRFYSLIKVDVMVSLLIDGDLLLKIKCYYNRACLVRQVS